ncbi:Cu+-exporting ATPase [Litoreibacter ponti]|uniref:Cu+-exporting ATPase n=1 Tax=Litoreibacter ponti TaxID=1510457 RepID=A0A2T6BNF1_9RHOB|nr:heavy metal translocating P-type ATPase [Litoreibacter ponti]PTX57610.1 Cu+-exporting ATPase [Litoreibacter ponti]
MELATETFALKGLSCAACAGRVERAFAAEPKIVQSSVNLATDTATVTWDADLLAVQDIVGVVEGAGYGAELLSPQDDPDQARDVEYEALRRDTAIAAFLTLPVFLVEMGSHFVPGVAAALDATIGMATLWIIQWVMITAVMAWPGRRFWIAGARSLVHAAPDMNALVAIGTTAAWAYSSVAIFLPAALPDGAQKVYLEAAGVIVTLILLGRLLEVGAKGRTGAAVARLLRLTPKEAMVQRNEEWAVLPLSEVRVGDRIRLRPGEQVPVDGTVRAGESFVDESMITGEPTAIAKSSGDHVVAGTVNGTGMVEFEATAVGQDTVLSGIVRMVREAQGAKLPIQALVDQVVRWFVPVVLVIASATVLIWLAFGAQFGLALVAGVSVLIVACPCAMGLATPTSVMVGTGRAAEEGVLFRKGDALQRLSDAKVIAFDKTGTLTEGQPELLDIVTGKGEDEDELLALAAAVEQYSEHPLAAAIARAAGQRGLKLRDARDFHATAGKGAVGIVEGRKVEIGSAGFLNAKTPFAEETARLTEMGQTVVYLSLDGEIRAAFGIADRIKDNARDTISGLHAKGFRTVMITGDAEATARAVARQIGLDDVIAGVMPDQKAAAIRDLGDGVAFVGDGINDAPALARADVGIAMGTGTDVAMETADVVLMSGNLAGVSKALEVSRRTMRNIRQNLFWAFIYNVLLIPVAAGVLYPFAGLLLSPMLAAGAMALSSVFVVTNALRLKTAGGPLA